MRKIYIEWYDAYSRDAWESAESIQKSCEPLMLCKTVGFLLNEDNNHLTICHTYNPFLVMGSLHIPKCSIKRLKRY